MSSRLNNLREVITILRSNQINYNTVSTQTDLSLHSVNVESIPVKTENMTTIYNTQNIHFCDSIYYNETTINNNGYLCDFYYHNERAKNYHKGMKKRRLRRIKRKKYNQKIKLLYICILIYCYRRHIKHKHQAPVVPMRNHQAFKDLWEVEKGKIMNK